MESLHSNINAKLTTNNIKKLAKNRITTIRDFLEEDVERVANILQLGLPCILEIRNNIFEHYSAPLLLGPSLLENYSTKQKFLKTGIISIDTILDGGLPIGFITEICGLAGSGKTQLCLQLSINTVKYSQKVVLYIDTKGDFSANRIQEIIEAQGLSHREMAIIMLKIKVANVFSMPDLLHLLEKIKTKEIVLDNLSLIIIDSLPSLMLQHFGDNNKIGLTFLNQFVNLSREISKEMELCVVCVNIETRWVDIDQTDLDDDYNTNLTVQEPSFLEKKNRCLGKYWCNIPVLVLTLERSLIDKGKDSSNITVSLQNFNNLSDNSKTIFLSINMLGVT
ncbi:unnamed protein product [Leptosia nina]|uniref:RecA family profile 1 domain-containing protein n=1 Tax=Leptosia nina TaxID=320188 RepID=A0AAV1JTB4_9NEOP